MKKVFFILYIASFVLFMNSCKIDNYDAPDATIQGQILDPNGNPIQTDQGGGNIRIRMDELSWSNGDPNISVTPTYLNVKQDGSYVNTKIFNGTYKMTPVEGAFYPYDAAGDTVKISGSVSHNFTVVPYLNVEWVTEPYVNDTSYVQAQIKFTRNVKAGVTQPSVAYYLLCISTNKYVGSGNYDGLLSQPIAVTNAQAGTVINIISKAKLRYATTTYYVRVGVNCNDAYKKYNYTDIKTVTTN